MPEKNKPEESEKLNVSDTLYEINPNAREESKQIIESFLTETNREERIALNRKRKEKSIERSFIIKTIQTTPRVIAKSATEIIDNFDAVLGLLSYSAAMLAAKYFESDKTIEGWLFAILALFLVIAKHRTQPGWLIELLRSPTAQMRIRIAEKYQDIEKTFKG